MTTGYDDIIFDCRNVQSIHPDLFKPVVLKQKKASYESNDEIYSNLTESQVQKQAMPDREPNVYDRLNSEKKKTSFFNKAESWFDKL